MSFKIAQLNLPAKANKVQTVSDIFIAQPDSIKESLAGKLMILVEISQADKNSLKLINFLFQQLSNNYYQNDKIILRERISTLKPEHIFETALAKTNKDLDNFIKQEKISLPLSAINVTAGLLYGKSLHFANTGKNRVLLFYRQAKEEASLGRQAGGEDGQDKDTGYKVSDLGKAAEEPAGQPAKSKLFCNVLSGELPPKSFIVAANEALPEYIAEKKLADIISTLPPAGAAEQIKSVLKNVNSYVSFQVLIIKAAKAEEQPAAGSSRQAKPGGISQLNLTETETEKILSPSGFLSFKRWGKIPFFAGKKTGAGKSLELKDKIYSQQKPVINLKKAATALKQVLLAAVNGLYYVLRLIARAPNIRAEAKNSLAYFKIFLNKTGKFFFSLNWKKRLLLLAALVSVVLLLVNINLNKKEQAQIAQNEEFQELIAEIEKKQHQAEASLLYSNEASAQKLFAEITELMEKLPQITLEQQSAYDDFKARLDLQLEKTNRVVRFAKKEVVADFKNINSAAAPESLFLMGASKRLYAADPGQGSIYMIDLDDLSVTAAADTTKSMADLRWPAKAGEESVYYFSADGIIELETAGGEIRSLPIDLLGEAGQFAAADSYNARYYLLNRQENQIYRYSRSGNTFSAPYAWIQEAADLSRAVDISIDGYVYVLLDNGAMVKYLRGNSSEFKLEAVSPPLSAPTRVYSSPDLKYLYIFEPAESRLVMYDKSGQFLEQYKDDFLGEAKDFAVDEAAKQLYFLKGSAVMMTPALHLADEDGG